jgi:hypothetical protein
MIPEKHNGMKKSDIFTDVYFQIAFGVGKVP